MDAEAALQRRSASYFQMNHVIFGPVRIGFSISWAREMPSDFFQLGASQSLSTRALWHSRGQYMLGSRQGKSRGKRAIGTLSSYFNGASAAEFPHLLAGFRAQE